jgi:hypothetical protein
VGQDSVLRGRFGIKPEWQSWGLDGGARCGSEQVFEASPEDLMGAPTTCAQHSRAGLRYGSDLTDADWAILQPFLPPPCECGRRREWPMRRIIEAIF